VGHALALLEELGPDARLLAGGHSLLPMMKLRLAKPDYVIDIDPLADALGYVTEHGDHVRIGAMARHNTLLESAVLARKLAIFTDAERVIADPVVRNRGTIGGALCQADPSEDLSAVCAAVKAQMVTAPRAGIASSTCTSSIAARTRPRWDQRRCWSRSASRCASTAAAPT